FPFPPTHLTSPTRATHRQWQVLSLEVSYRSTSTRAVSCEEVRSRERQSHPIPEATPAQQHKRGVRNRSGFRAAGPARSQALDFSHSIL
ncbi:hypothetical protein BGW80DRAFT_1278292, partial [Lactifluus volemus]